MAVTLIRKACLSQKMSIDLSWFYQSTKGRREENNALLGGEIDSLSVPSNNEKIFALSGCWWHSRTVSLQLESPWIPPAEASLVGLHLRASFNVLRLPCTSTTSILVRYGQHLCDKRQS